MATTYTFGDSGRAQARLELLAALYASSSGDFIGRVCSELGRVPHHACDLGCGPGYSTWLLHERSAARHTTGLDDSEAFLKSAEPAPGVRFVRHDVTRTPFPCPPADLLYSRFLLTHLVDRGRVLRIWASQLTSGGLVALEELDHMVGSVPSLQRYYGMVAFLQNARGQEMNVGPALPVLAREAGLQVRIDRTTHLVLPGHQMAMLHYLNIQTWRHDAFIANRYSGEELDDLEADLRRLASDPNPLVYVDYYMRQLIAGPRP